MTSVSVRTRQVSTDNDYFIAVASLGNQVYITPDTASAVAPWASTSFGAGSTPGGGLVAGSLSSAVIRASTVGQIFRDMGKSVVSSGVYFRKIQLVVPQGTTGTTSVVAGATSTVGVAGHASVTGVPDFFTGYIRLGFEGQGGPAPVAKFGR